MSYDADAPSSCATTCTSHHYYELGLKQVHPLFLQVTLPRENPRVFPFISRMVLRLNPRIFKAEGRSATGLPAIMTIYSLQVQHVSCKELNLGGEDNNHSSQPLELNPIDKFTLQLVQITFSNPYYLRCIRARFLEPDEDLLVFEFNDKALILQD
jgi:hypothetical protein